MQKSYLSETPTYLKKGSDTSLYAAPPRGVFLVRLDVPLGTSGHFIALEETFNYEKHPPPNLGRYIADLRREYGLTAFEAAKLHAEAISQIDFEALCAPVSWGSRIAPKTWQGYGVYKDEYNVLREIVVDREDAVARAFALEVQEVRQSEERSDELTTPSQVAKTSHAHTSYKTRLLRNLRNYSHPLS